MAFSDRGMQQLAALRQKRKDAAANAKPVFGPHPSKAIFKQKWLTKLNTHHLTFPHRPRDRTQQRPMREVVDKMIPYMSTAFDLVTAFDAEAAALDLCASDFASQLPPADTPDDLDWSNPFLVADRLRDHVDIMVYRWKSHGLGRDMMLGRSEVDKQRLRKEFEDLRVKIFEADEAGKWDTAAAAEMIAYIRAELESEPGFLDWENGRPTPPRQRRKWC